MFGTKPYLSPIIDPFNGEVVDYTLSRSPNLALITDMLEKAFAKIPDNTNLILHSGQGRQHQHLTQTISANVDRQRYTTKYVSQR